MLFRVVGAERETGEDVDMTIEALTPGAAEEQVNRMGILVQWVEPTPAGPAPSMEARPASHQPQSLALNAPPGRVIPVVVSSPPVTVNIKPHGSSLGAASLALGGLAFLICWIPFVGVLGVPLCILGLLLGGLGLILALVRGGAGVGYPIGGLAVSGFALWIAFTVTGAAHDALATGMGLQSQETNQTIIADGAGQSGQSEWALATGPVRQGDTQVEVVSVSVRRVKLVNALDSSRSTSGNQLLSIKVRIHNTSRNRKIEYQSWAGARFSLTQDYAVLRDNFNNIYKRIDFGYSARPAGHIESKSLYPGKDTTDVLVFEEPIRSVEFLNLRLPAGNFGGTGMLRLRIPAEMIHRDG